ncbi:MAG: cyclic lactone autoinducer peptide [Firmicutes bacterium]|nr:cyclic lactone autoinducer peptide [Bacillota bacterium]
MKRISALMVVLFTTIFAMLFTCAACIWSYYQPEMPQKPEK